MCTIYEKWEFPAGFTWGTQLETGWDRSGYWWWVYAPPLLGPKVLYELKWSVFWVNAAKIRLSGLKADEADLSFMWTELVQRSGRGNQRRLGWQKSWTWLYFCCNATRRHPGSRRVDQHNEFNSTFRVDYFVLGMSQEGAFAWGSFFFGDLELA